VLVNLILRLLLDILITFVKNNIVDSMSCLQLCEVCQLAAQERIHLHRGPIVSVVELNQTMEQVCQRDVANKTREAYYHGYIH
jgi:hypothetical protein